MKGEWSDERWKRKSFERTECKARKAKQDDNENRWKEGKEEIKKIK